MTTPRRPWPEWSGLDYYRLLALARNVIKLGHVALEVQHENIYLTARHLSKMAAYGQRIVGIIRLIEAHRPDDERGPKWVNEALRVGKEGGKFIQAGAKHGLDGIDKDNWKMVLKGINTCLGYALKIETCLLDGPPPGPEFGPSESLLKTLEMGERSETAGGARWKRTNKDDY